MAFFQWLFGKAVRDKTGQPIAPVLGERWEAMVARHRAAEEKAWWRDMTRFVGETDKQLVIIQPYGDATADDLRSLGQALARWKVEFPQARHIWGLTDLLEGRHPRTPPIYVMVPFPVEGYEDCYEEVALVYVAQGTDIEAAVRDLIERLNNLLSMLVCVVDPDTYSSYNR